MPDRLSHLVGSGGICFLPTGSPNHHWDPVPGDIEEVFQEPVTMEVEYQWRMQKMFAQYREPGSAQYVLELRDAIHWELWMETL